MKRIAVEVVTRDGRLRTFSEIEADVIRAALLACKGDMQLAASTLGIARSTLYEKKRQHNIDVDRIRKQTPT